VARTFRWTRCHPDNRVAFALDDAAAGVVLTTTDLANRLPDNVTAICLDDAATAQMLAGKPATRPQPVAGPGNLAYLIYTSGSTGKPKGVLVEHRSAVNFTTLIIELFCVTPEYRVLQFANPSFDVSVFEIFSCLCGGATLIQAPRETLHDPGRAGRTAAHRAGDDGRHPAERAGLDGRLGPSRTSKSSSSAWSRIRATW
jgi:non-ribosomal peptide synthetase component F